MSQETPSQNQKNISYLSWIMWDRLSRRPQSYKLAEVVNMVVSSSLCHLCMPIVFSGICIHTRSQEFQAITSMLKLSIGRKMQRSIMDIWRRRPPNKSVLQGIESAFEQYIMIRSLTLIAVQHVTLMSQVVIFSGNSFFFQAVT